MIEYYNAFISYKHAPVDNQVAAHIQSALEHFHIPGKIRKKTGKKQIQRVFRDKDELPITSDLSDTISQALENSDYLIVICSTSTCKSEWVKREIQYFLRNHTHDQILTVLAEGEPEEVIPEELRTEERLLPNADGSASYVKVPIEPLSCDYRMPFRQADKEELPRLAAALIGCSYDELMNRRRQYQMRRIGILALILTVLALGFSFYTVSAARKIDKNYQASLRNQSLYLANESQKLLEDERRIEAIQIALEALPNDQMDRPVTAEAIKALTDATLAYQPVSGTSIYSVWNYRMASTISKMEVSPDGECFACIDATGSVSVWDTETHELLLEYALSDYKILGMTFVDENTFIFWGGRECYCFELDSKDRIWTLKLDYKINTDCYALSEDRKSLYLPTNKGKFIKVSTDGGKVVNEWDISQNNNHNVLVYYNVVLSPDEKNILLSFESLDTAYVAIFEPGTGQYREKQLPNPKVVDAIWTDPEHFLVAYYDPSDVYSYEIGSTKMVRDDFIQIDCFSQADFSTVWSNQAQYNDIRIRAGFLALPGLEQTAFFCSNSLMNFQNADGQVVFSYNLTSSLVSISDRDGDGLPMGISTDGDIITLSPSNGETAFASTATFTDRLDLALVNNGVYVHKDGSNEVIFYDAYVGDEDWERIEEIPTVPTSNTCISGDYMVIEVANSDTIELIAFDISSHELIWKERYDDLNRTCSFLGIYDEVLYLVTADSVLLGINVEDGSVEVNEKITEQVSYVYNIATLTDEKLAFIYSASSKNDGYLKLLDLDTNKSEKFDLLLDSYQPNMPPVYFSQADAIYYSDSNEGDYIVNVEENEFHCIEFPSSWTGTAFVHMDPSGEFFLVGDSKSVLVLDREGETVFEVNHLDIRPLGSGVYSAGKNKEELLVIYADGALCRYDLKTGELLGKMQTSIDDMDGVFKVSFQFYLEQSTLYLQRQHVTYVIDLNSWVEVATVGNCLGYNPINDEFLSYAVVTAKEVSMGYFRHYTLDELIEKGKKITQNTELTQEQRSEYGI